MRFNRFAENFCPLFEDVMLYMVAHLELFLTHMQVGVELLRMYRWWRWREWPLNLTAEQHDPKRTKNLCNQLFLAVLAGLNLLIMGKLAYLLNMRLSFHIINLHRSVLTVPFLDRSLIKNLISGLKLWNKIVTTTRFHNAKVQSAITSR